MEFFYQQQIVQILVQWALLWILHNRVFKTRNGQMSEIERNLLGFGAMIVLLRTVSFIVIKEKL